MWNFACALGILLCSASIASANDKKPLEDIYFTYSSILGKSLAPRGFLILDAARLVDEWSEDLTSPQGPFAQSVASVIDQAGTSWIENRTSAPFSQIYAAILFEAEWAKVPLTSAQRSALADVEKKLFVDGNAEKPTGEYHNYIKLKDRVAELQSKYDSASPEKKDDFKDDLESAKEDLSLLGKANIFHPLEASYESLLRIKRNELQAFGSLLFR